jgi:zinc/manganese transport system substrate-binding protein
MKRQSILLLFALFLSTVSLHATIKAVASTSDLANIAGIVGGDNVTIDFIVRGEQNPHYIEVKPSYMMKLRNADLFFVVGMQLELWSSQIVDGSRNTKLRIVDCSGSIHKLEVPATKVDASGGDVHPYGNPHYWLDPENAKIVADEMCAAFTELDPAHAVAFSTNLRTFKASVDEKLVDWKRRMAPFNGRKLVTYHSSFSYFADRFGLVVAAYVEPKPGISPSPSHTVELIQRMKKEDIRIIGLEQYFEENVPQQIAQAAGARVVHLSTSVGGRDGTDSYLSLIEYDVQQIEKAFGAK